MFRKTHPTFPWTGFSLLLLISEMSLPSSQLLMPVVGSNSWYFLYLSSVYLDHLTSLAQASSLTYMTAVASTWHPLKFGHRHDPGAGPQLWQVESWSSNMGVPEIVPLFHVYELERESVSVPKPSFFQDDWKLMSTMGHASAFYCPAFCSRVLESYKEPKHIKGAMTIHHLYPKPGLLIFQSVDPFRYVLFAASEPLSRTRNLLSLGTSCSESVHFPGLPFWGLAWLMPTSAAQESAPGPHCFQSCGLFCPFSQLQGRSALTLRTPYPGPALWAWTCTFTLCPKLRGSS